MWLIRKDNYRILLGSTAAKVIREMSYSVIIIKSEHVVRLKLEAEIADPETHYEQGKKLFDQVFPKDALVQFEYCLLKHDVMFAPAWDGIAVAHEQLGDKKSVKGGKNDTRTVMVQTSGGGNPWTTLFVQEKIREAQVRE